MAKSVEDRLYTRVRGGAERWYADFRDHAALGGGREALKAKGALNAATDRAEALRLAKARLQELERLGAENRRLGLDPRALLETVGAEMLLRMSKGGRYAETSLLYTEGCLARAVEFFEKVQPAQPRRGDPRRLAVGPRNLSTISPPDVREFMAWLATQPSGRMGEDGEPGTLGAQSIRHHVHALSAVFEEAIADGLVEMGKNPAASAKKHKPPVPKSRTPLREVDEVAMLLESARTMKPPSSLPCAFEFVAAYAYTGGRDAEVRGLDIPDLNFDRREIHIRGTKTTGADRWVPMHDELHSILLPYVRRLGRISGPLFVSGRSGERVGDWRKTLDRLARRVGYPAGAIRTKQFRVAYATHRCTCDGVDANTVRTELGHSSLVMMERVYARAQRRSRRMGATFAYVLTPEERALYDARVAAQELPRVRPISEDRRQLVADYLASIEGLGTKRAAALTGVDRAAIQRLRQGARPENVQGKTLEAVASYLARTPAVRASA